MFTNLTPTSPNYSLEVFPWVIDCSQMLLASNPNLTTNAEENEIKLNFTSYVVTIYCNKLALYLFWYRWKHQI